MTVQTLGKDGRYVGADLNQDVKVENGNILLGHEEKMLHI